MIRVFIADDHAIVRHGLRELLSSCGDMQVVGEASDGRQLLNIADSVECDVVILDLSLPRVNGPEPGPEWTTSTAKRRILSGASRLRMNSRLLKS